MADGIDELFDPRSVGETLYLLRKRAALSREELAKEAEVVLSTVSRIENETTRGGVIDARALSRIIGVLAPRLGLSDERLLWEAILQALKRQDRADAAHYYLQAELRTYQPKPKRTRKPKSKDGG